MRGRFTAVASFPSNRRIFVLPEPAEVRPPRPPAGPTLQDHVRALMEAFPDHWFKQAELAAAVGVPLERINDTLWGFVTRAVVIVRAIDPSKAAPQFNREYRWRGQR